jgi:hypothetical protein
MIIRLVQILLLATLGSVAGATPDGIPKDTTQPIVVRMTQPHIIYQGSYNSISITKAKGDLALSGFGFEINYDPAVLAFASAELGSALGSSGCGWKYLASRLDSTTNSPGNSSLALLRIVAATDSLTGPPPLTACHIPDGGELVRIKFLVTNDRTYAGFYSAVRFCWRDCQDNALISSQRDTLFVSRRVLDMTDIDHAHGQRQDNEITGADCRFSVHFGGDCAGCDSLKVGKKVTRLVDFQNGGIYICCGDVEPRGDLNLNGIANEIADARLLADALVEGRDILIRGRDILPNVAREAAESASDVNGDGYPLTVADLVYLQRIIIGDAIPYPKVRPFGDSAEVTFSDGLFSIESPSEIAGVLAIFNCDSNYSVESQSILPVTSFFDITKKELRVLAACGSDDPDTTYYADCNGRHLPAGENKLFKIRGRANLLTTQVSDYNGSLLLTSVGNEPSRRVFDVADRVLTWPERDNARIDFYLPTESDWRIDIYYQNSFFQSYSGRDIGHKVFQCDATNWCPGTYTYGLSVGSFYATRPLIKW